MRERFQLSPDNNHRSFRMLFGHVISHIWTLIACEERCKFQRNAFLCGSNCLHNTQTTFCKYWMVFNFCFHRYQRSQWWRRKIWSIDIVITWEIMSNLENKPVIVTFFYSKTLSKAANDKEQVVLYVSIGSQTVLKTYTSQFWGNQSWTITSLGICIVSFPITISSLGSYTAY